MNHETIDVKIFIYIKLLFDFFIFTDQFDTKYQI